MIAPTWHDATLALPVVNTAPGWLKVRLVARPNGGTGWVAASDVSLATTASHIVVDIASNSLDLYDAGRLVLRAPAGVGTTKYPTPTGHFFVAFFAQAPDAGYGPFVVVTSAHSDAITDWDHSGDAIVAIHGPVGADSAIGTTGAALSHGCVRLHVADLAKLRNVPAGSPVDIIGPGSPLTPADVSSAVAPA